MSTPADTILSPSLPAARVPRQIATTLIGALVTLWGLSALGYHGYALAISEGGVLRGWSIGPRFFILLSLAAAAMLTTTGFRVLCRDRRALRLALVSLVMVPLTAYLGFRTIRLAPFFSPGMPNGTASGFQGGLVVILSLLLLGGLIAYLVTSRTHREFGTWEGPPFSAPIWGRIWRDYWYITIICGATLFAFHWLVITFLPLYNMRYRLNIIQNLPDIVKAMIGQDILEITTWTSIGAFAYLHPVSLAVLVAFAVMLPSWILVGQIDRGTIELLLSTPLTRKKMVYTAALAGLVGGALIIGCMLLGTWVGTQRINMTQPFNYSRIVTVAVNLYAVYLLIMSISVFFSCITSIRGIAVGWAMAVCVAAYLIHFLAEWWPLVQKIAFLGPLYYFRPIKIASGTYDPTLDIVILTGTGAAFLILSTVWFSRRDIAVV